MCFELNYCTDKNSVLRLEVGGKDFFLSDFLIYLHFKS